MTAQATIESVRYRLTVGCESGGVRMPVLQTAGVWLDAASALSAACEIVGKPLSEADRTMQQRGIVATPCLPIGWKYMKHLPVAGVSIDRVLLSPDGDPARVDTTFPGLHLNAARASGLPSVERARRSVTRLW